MRQATALLVLGTVLSAGCAGVPHRVSCTPVVTAEQRGMIFVANGAGGWHATSDTLHEAVTAEHVPLGVTAVEWSHGQGRFLADEMDAPYAREAGAQLAAQIAAYLSSYPNGDVYLVGHSAGSAVVLSAAAHLPAGSVERVILLAPSVSADYDLRDALRATRSGIDVFYSRRDRAYLGVGVAIVGTADGCWGCAAAGRVGFRPVIETPADKQLYAKLHQHGWDEQIAWTGNHGGHYGCHEAKHVRAYVLPLLHGSLVTSGAP